SGVLEGNGLGIVDLPVYRDDEQVISCWKIPLLRRFKVLFTRRVYLQVLGQTHPPLHIETDAFEKL
ncbi:unnamed protein product, partial [marine sediment metagenome]